MKKMIFGCTLLIMGTLFSEYSFLTAIPFWTVGFIFILLAFSDDKDGK